MINEYPYVKIGYKTNISSGTTPSLDYYTTYNSETNRLWGPKLSHIANGLPNYNIIGIKFSTSGGYDITDFSWDNVAHDALYDTLHIKLWGAQTISVAADEYYDISYIAFFKDINAAITFEYPDNVPLYGDVNNDYEVNAADEILLTRYNASIRGYLSLEKMRAADVNNDGSISVLDGAILARHIAGWTKYATLPYEN